MVLFKLDRKQEKTIRRKFLNELGIQLSQLHMKEGSTKTYLENFKKILKT
jgi:hypothetical protein